MSENTKTRRMSTKIIEKYFENDSNVNRFYGIFSAHYCWPEECEQELRPKCWSDVMFGQSYDCFALKLWPKVVTKLPVITTTETTVQQMNELLFALVLKESDLLSGNQIKYFESVLDLFDGEITFGISFWLKICSQFNWRLIYIQLIVGHKHRKQLIELLFEEIGSKATAEDQKCFTTEEICYFYSLVDCCCLQSMANNVINNFETINDQFFNQIHNKCSQKLFELKYNSIVRQLSYFNVFSQTWIHFTLKLCANPCLEEGSALKQFQRLNEIFTENFIKIETESEIPINDQKIREDIGITRDNRKSLDLVLKQYFLLNNTNPELSTKYEKFYEFIDNKSPKTIQTKRFTYLLNILNDRQNSYCLPLIQSLITFADFYTFEPLLKTITANDILRFDLLTLLAKRVVRLRDCDPKRFFVSLLNQSLKMSSNIDLKIRLNEFKINRIIEPKNELIKTLFNQITSEDKTGLNDQLVHELLIAVYLDPFPVFSQLLDLALHHNKAQLGLVAKLLSTQLYCISKYRSNEENESFLIKFIVHKLMEKPSILLVEDLTKLIEQMIRCEEEGVEPVLALDQLFFYLVSDQCLVKSDVVSIKLLFIKSIVLLSGDQSWPSIQTNPVPTIVYLLQFLDYFWRTPTRKQLVIDILDLVLNEKMTQNLTETQFNCLDQILAKRLPRKASTHRIYLTYCEKRFPKPIREVIDLTKNIFHDQILHYSTITSDFMWICETYPEYQVFTEHMNTALVHILPALTAQEFKKLYKFLQMYYYNNSVINHLRNSISNIRDSNVDKKFLINTFLDIVFEQFVTPMREESVERPLSYEDYKYYEMDLGVVFKTLAVLEYSFLPNDLCLKLIQILTEVAERMKLESIDAYGLYNYDEKVMPSMARRVLQSTYGTIQYVEVYTSAPTGLMPAGAQPPTRPPINCVPEPKA